MSNIDVMHYSKHSCFLRSFYAPEGTSGGILKLHRPSVCPSVINRFSAIIQIIDKGNLFKLHRKIKQNEKVCRAQNLGSLEQGQGHNQRSNVFHLQIMCPA